MQHSCPDGTHTRLIRTGPVGTVDGVTYACPRCGYSQPAAQILEDFEQARASIKAALSPRITQPRATCADCGLEADTACPHSATTCSECSAAVDATGIPCAAHPYYADED